MSTIDASCYLVIDAVISKNGYLEKGPTIRVTKNSPSLSKSERAVKLNINLPRSLFQQPQLTASIIVPQESAPPVIDANVQDNIAETIREMTGLDVTIRVEAAE